jgi:hypothetical protein
VKLGLMEEKRLRVLDNSVLREIFGPESEQVTGGLRYLHNEKLHNLYSSASIITVIESRRMRLAGMRQAWENINTFGRPDGTRPVGRPRRIWEDYIESSGWGCGLE